MNDASDSDAELSGSIIGPGVEKGPLVDKMPSPAYRKLSLMITKSRRSADDLRSLIKEHAAEGHLRPGEAGALRRELDSISAPNAKSRENARGSEDTVFVEDCAGKSQKPKLFRKPVVPERKSVIPAGPAMRESQAPKPPKQGYSNMVIVNTGAGIGIFTRRK